MELQLQDIEDLPVGLQTDSRVRTEEYKLKQKLRKKKGQERAKQFKNLEGGEGSDGEVEFDSFQSYLKYINNKDNNHVPGTQRIYIKTYGCSHNISDSEFMMGLLVDYGYQLVDSMEECDLVIINSCTVKNPSEQTNQAKQIKKPLVVAGCVPQGDRHLKEIKDISIIGVTQIDRVVEVVEETLKGNVVQLLTKKDLPSLDLPKIRKNQFIEIIPINAGCLGACTYCKTKHARGKLLSYSLEAILNRVKSVAEQGVREIWLTSEDTGAYGRDIGTNISMLLRNMIDLLPEGVMLRIGMTNPPYIMEHLQNMALILNHPRVYSFLHIPVQSGSNTCLERMNREYTREEFEIVCDYLIKHVPGISLCTDIICGFPGETDQEFDETMSLIEKYKFPALNISQFYSRPGTPAAKMKKVDSKEVKARSSKLTKLFESFHRTNHLLQTIQRVFINEKEEKNNKLIMVGHTKGYVKVILPYESQLLGKEVVVRVENVLTWHVEGTIVERNPKAEIIADSYWDEFIQNKSSKTEQKVQEILKGQQEEESEEFEEEKEDKQAKHENCKCSKSGEGCNNGANCKCSKEKKNEEKEVSEPPKKESEQVATKQLPQKKDRLAHIVIVVIAIFVKSLIIS